LNSIISSQAIYAIWLAWNAQKMLQITHMYYYIHNTNNVHSKYSLKNSKKNYHEIATSQIQCHHIFSSLHLGFETTSSKIQGFFP
jgi:hypothetical protein